MNPILEQVINSRSGHYCHVVEVSSKHELECIADAIYDENENEHKVVDIIDFLESLTVYCLEDENEGEVFDFSFTDYLEQYRVF